MTLRRQFLPLVLALLAPACGSAGDRGGDDDVAATPDGGGGGGNADAAPVQASGENCASPIVVDLSNGSVTLEGTTVGKVHDYDGPPACAVHADSVDTIYQVQVPPGGVLKASYTGTGIGLDVVSVEAACPDTTLIGGCTAGDPMAVLDHDREFPDGGLASVFVWSEPGSTYTLTLELTGGVE